MKKIRFAVFFLFLFILPFFHTGAMAASSTHFHPRISFEIPINSEAGFQQGSELYLTSDIKLTADIPITQSVSLCLNGFTIDMGPYSFIVEKNAVFSIYTCPATGAGTVIAESGEKAAFHVLPEGEVQFWGGHFQTSGRSIVTNMGVTQVGGGNFSGNDVELIQSIGNAFLTINGGDLHAGGSGSAVVLNADPTEAAGKRRDYNVAIANCHITAGPDSPGAVVVNAAKRRLVLGYGTDIQANGCPGVLVKDGIFDAYDRSCVYSNSDSAIVGTGGKVSLYYCVVTSDEEYAVDIRDNAELLLSGSLELLGGKASVHLSKGKVFSMSDYGFYGDVHVTVQTEEAPEEGGRVPISTKCDPKHYKHFYTSNAHCSITYDESTGIIYNSYDPSVSHSHDGRNYVIPLNGSYSDVSKNNYYLDSDTISPGFFTGGVVNICLNGHKLTLSNAIKIYPNSTLNIFDCKGGGSIECNSTCISAFDNGIARVIVHQGDIISHGSAAIKFNGNDSLVVKTGSITSPSQLCCAVECSDTDNSIMVNENASINGGLAGVQIIDGPIRPLQDGEVPSELALDLGGTGIINGGSYAVICVASRPLYLNLNDAPQLKGNSAEIELSDTMLLSTGSNFAPVQKYRVSFDPAAPRTILGKASIPSHQNHFSLTSSDFKLSSIDGLLELVSSLPITPSQASTSVGTPCAFSVDAPGSGYSYEWYTYRVGDQTASRIENAATGSVMTPSDLRPGTYEIYCLVADGTTRYVSDSAQLIVEPPLMEEISITAGAPLVFNGEPQVPSLQVEEIPGVVLSYSLDGQNYTAEIPAIGPEIGVYTIYYRAQAEGCDDMTGQLTVEIVRAKSGDDLDINSMSSEALPRFYAIIASAGILLILAIVWCIFRQRRK